MPACSSAAKPDQPLSRPRGTEPSARPTIHSPIARRHAGRCITPEYRDGSDRARLPRAGLEARLHFVVFDMTQRRKWRCCAMLWTNASVSVTHELSLDSRITRISRYDLMKQERHILKQKKNI